MSVVGSWVRRHAAALVAGALLSALFVFSSFLPRRADLNLWPDLVSGLSQATLLVGPLAAGACALIASRSVTPLRERLAGAARRVDAVFARNVWGTVLPVAASLPVALSILSIYGAASGTYGVPSPAWLSALASATFVACAFGYTVGHRVGSRWFTAPGTALAYFGLFVLVQSAPLPYGFRSLFPAIANRDTEFARYITATMWGQSAFFLAVSALLLLAARCTHFPRERWHVLAATAAVVTGCLAGSVVVGTNGQYVAGYNPRDFVCAGEAPEICVNRGYQEGLEGLRGRFDALYAKAAGTSLLATRVEQNVEGVGDLPAPGARSIYIEGVDAEGLDQTVGRYVEKYGGFAACDLEHVPYDTLMATIIVDTWLSGFDDYDLAELDPATPAGREWKALSVLSAESGNRWLRDHERAYLTCALSLDDLP